MTGSQPHQSAERCQHRNVLPRRTMRVVFLPDDGIMVIIILADVTMVSVGDRTAMEIPATFPSPSDGNIPKIMEGHSRESLDLQGTGTARRWL